MSGCFDASYMKGLKVRQLTLKWHFLRLYFSAVSINPFLANAIVLYPLKTSENERFLRRKVFGVFKGYKMGTLTRTG